MMSTQSKSRKRQKTVESGITAIAIRGYKSLVEEYPIEVRPLTLLAGANSSGKSSVMQPLLLLKQTLEVSYDPGALLLDGPNVRITSTEQFLSKTSGKTLFDNFTIKIDINNIFFSIYNI